MKLEPESNPTEEITNYWMKLLISGIFGMLTYYALAYLPRLQGIPGRWGPALSFILLLSLYLSTLFIAPFIYRLIKIKAPIWENFKFSILKGNGTAIALYILLCTVNFVIDI